MSAPRQLLLAHFSSTLKMPRPDFGWVALHDRSHQAAIMSLVPYSLACRSPYPDVSSLSWPRIADPAALGHAVAPQPFRRAILPALGDIEAGRCWERNAATVGQRHRDRYEVPPSDHVVFRLEAGNPVGLESPCGRVAPFVMLPGCSTTRM